MFAQVGVLSGTWSQWCVFLSLAFWWVSCICSDLCIRLETDFTGKEILSCMNTGCTDSSEASSFWHV